MMMADAASCVAKIASIALQIKTTVDTAQQNKRRCGKIGKRVTRLHGILLGKTEELMQHPAMTAMLADLEETLGQALDLVMACQEKTLIAHLFRAKSLSQELDRVNQDISDRMMDVIFDICFQVNIRLVHANPHEDARVGESSQIDTGETASINYLVEIDIAKGQGSEATRISTRFITFRFSELEVATNNFSNETVIRSGGHATVYKGVLPDGLVVAIKRFNDAVTQSLRQYVHVFSVLVQHKNIVQSVGYCSENKQEIVVEEYMPNGSLSDIIYGLSQPIDWSSMLQIIRGIAEGVAYLHINHVIHMNLNPANIVLDSEMNPKICDFETCKILDQIVTEEVTEDLVGTVGYKPPEYIADGIISMKSDVFSFGVLILFMISGMGRTVLDQHPIGWAWKAREAGKMKELFNHSLTDESELKNIDRCMEIGLLCTQEFPVDRPSMPDVIKALNSHENLPLPKKPGFVKVRASPDILGI